MSASFSRPKPTTRDMLVASRDALDVAEDIQRAASHARIDADTLFAFPADAEARIAVRLKARRIIALCDEMERLQGPSPVVEMAAFRGRPS